MDESSVAGVSSLSFPSRAILTSTCAATPLETEAQRKTVSALTRSPEPFTVSPYPFAKVILPFSTIAMAMPAISSFDMISWALTSNSFVSIGGVVGACPLAFVSGFGVDEAGAEKIRAKRPRRTNRNNITPCVEWFALSCPERASVF